MLDFENYSDSQRINFISVIEDRNYFLWQQEVQLFHFNENFKHLNFEVIILHENEEPSKWATHLSTLGNVSYYPLSKDESKQFESYKAGFKPYGLYKRLDDNTKPLLENVLALDADVILNRDLSYTTLFESDHWMFSDCESYLGYEYMSTHLTEEQITALTDIVGIKITTLKEAGLAGGAQYLYKKPKPTFFKKAALDSLKLYEQLKIYEEEGSEIQVHTAEMWSQLWNTYQHSNLNVTESLGFAWATDKLEEMEVKPFTHFAGTPPEGSFRKVGCENPFTEDLSHVTITDNCAYHWKTLIEKYKPKSFSVLHK